MQRNATTMTQRLDYERQSPGAMKSLGGVYHYVATSGLAGELIDLVYLRVSLINGCAYCIDSHTKDLQKKNVAPQKISLVPVWHEAGTIFSSREKAALRWAETLTRVLETHAPDDDYQAVAAEFTEKELVDLTVAIGLMNIFNRIAIGFKRGPQIQSQQPQTSAPLTEVA